jgi:peptidyl-prolyl cis-trans isomerase C
MNLLKNLLLTLPLSALLIVGTALAAEESKLPQPEQKSASTSTETMAVVNGTTITRGELERAMNTLLANQGKQSIPPELKKQAEAATLEQLIAAELLYQEGSKLEIKDIEQKIADKIKQSKAKIGSEEAFAAALKSVGLTDKELTVLTRKDIVITNLIDSEIASKMTATEAEAKKFYDDNIDKFKKEESVRASHILCSVDPQATPEDKKKAKEKAEALLKRVKGGEDFAAVAKAESGCPSGKNGGDLGEFGRGQMVKPFEDTAFSLKPGELSDVVETQFGYHIIKVVDKKPAVTTNYDDVKLKIVDYLKGLKVQKGINEYLKGLQAKAKIDKPAAK